MLLAFALVVALNTVLSVNIGLSINKLITAFINWFGIFVSGCIYFRKPTAFRWVCFLVIMTMPFEFFICVWEYKIRAIPWIGHIPAIFKVDDDIIDTIVHNSGRAYTNQYRVHGTFYIPLSLGEFLGLSWPIAYYFIFTAKTILKRIMYVAILLMMLSMAVISGSRNAFATLAVGSAYCIVLWVVRYMRLNRRALLATAMPLLMAVAAGGFMVAALSVSRIRKLFTGDGSAQSSTDARVIQWQTGIPKVLSRPWGHGIGTGAQVLNYHDPGGFLTIDSYMLNLLIEYGIIGFAIYIFMFGLAIFLSVRLFLRYMKSDRAWYSATIGGVALCFLISKLVFSGEYNHWMVFLALAALLCEIAHLRQEQAKLVPT